MKLDEYLKALDQCPEGREERKYWHELITRDILTWELGIYDNFPILLNADFNKVVDHLRQSEYELIEKTNKVGFEDIDKTKQVNYIFHYKPGTVLLQVKNSAPSEFCLFSGWSEDKSVRAEGEKHEERMRTNYNMGMLLHPYQKKEMEGVGRMRAISMVVKDIALYAQREGIGLCLPNSMGQSHGEDWSRIVYYP